MADEYQQPQLHHHHEAEEERAKIESFDDRKSFTTFTTVDADMATTEIKNVADVVGDETAVEARDKGFFGNFTEKKKPEEEEVNEVETEFEKVNFSEEPEMKDELVKETKECDATEVIRDEAAVEDKSRGLFGNFTGEKKVDEEEVATEFEKMNVSEEAEEKIEEKKLQRSHSTSSISSSDEEDGVAGEKKHKKKGTKEKIKDMVSGGSDKEEEKAEIKTINKQVEVSFAEPIEVAYEDTEQTKSTENAPATPVSKVEEADTQQPETKEKKCILEKIKEKIPGYQTKPANN